MQPRAAVAATAVAVALVSPAVASAQAPEYFGANIQSLIRLGFVQPAGWPPYLDEMARSGLRIARFDAPWMWAQPDSGGQDFDWRRFDQVATALAGAGLRWLPVIDLAPAWAKAPEGGLAPQTYPALAAFAGAFAARYGPGGAFWVAHPELAPVPPATYEVWNEPNTARFWERTPAPAEYLELARQVRQAVKAADPSATVLASLGWEGFAGYLQGLYDAGLRGAMDGIAFHPYAPGVAGVVAMVRELRAITARNGEPRLPVQITEIGWPKAPDGADQLRAATLALTADALAASDCDVGGYLVYSLVEEERDPANADDWLGLLARDGAPTASLRAMAAASARWAQSVAGASSRAAPPPVLELCGGRDPAAGARSAPITTPAMPRLDLAVPGASPTPCFAVATEYHGDPLPDVTVAVRQYQGRQSAVTTHPDGTGQLCMSAASRANPFLAWARLGAIAASPLLYCARGQCYTTECARADLRLAARRVAARRARVTLSVRCGRRTMFGERVAVEALDAAGRARPLAALVTRPQAERHTYAIDPRRDRALRLSFAGDPVFQLPAARRTVRL